MDGATFVSLTGSLHREDETAHVPVLDPEKCITCAADYASSCTHLCPGPVYPWDGEKVALSASNRLHCMTCAVKCPLENIRWLPPEGGEGPRFTQVGWTRLPVLGLDPRAPPPGEVHEEARRLGDVVGHVEQVEVVAADRAVLDERPRTHRRRPSQ